MQRADYVNKLETMIEEGITNGKYMVTDDNTLKDLKSFEDFLTRNFKSSLSLNKVKPTSNQPAFLYGTAKTHKFQNYEQITKDNLKLRPIVSTCGTFYYETAKFLASYLLPLTENEYSIKTTTDFAERLSNRTVDDDEVLVSHVFYDRYVDDCFSKMKKNEPDALSERLNRYHLTLFSLSRKTPTIFLILPLVIPTSSIAASSRNRGNYQHIGNLRSLPSGKGIASLAHSTEPNASLPILTRT